MGKCLCVKIFCVTSIFVSYNDVQCELSVNQSRCRPGSLLLCQDWSMLGMGRRHRRRPRKNKRTKTSLERKRKKQSKQLSYIINPPQHWPPHGSLTTPGTPGCTGMWQAFGQMCVCVFGMVLCPAAAEQNICWMQSGQVRGWEREGHEAEIKGNSRYAQRSSDSYWCIFVSP